MDLRTYLRILRRRWATVFVVLSVCVGLAAVVTVLTPNRYQSNIQFFVSTSQAGDTADLAQGSTFTQKRVKSYTQIVRTPLVLGPVIEASGVDLTQAELQSNVEATSPPDTVLLRVSVQDRSRERARRIAEALSTQFPAIVEKLESVDPDQPSPVKLTLVGPPTSSPTPYTPRPTRNVILGLLAGLVLGAGAAVLKHLLDTRIRSKDDVEEITDAVVLGGIPFDSDAEKRPLIIQADPLSGRAEAFRSLRTNLQFIDAASHPRVMVVTSSIASEGKSSTVANLALAMAEAHQRVCVVEADLRRPKLLSYLGMEGAVGLTDVLIGRVALEDVLQQFGSNSLTVLGAGATPPNPSELLGSEGMIDVLRHLSARYDHVIIDGPPLLPVTDSAVLSRLADGAIIVVGSGIVTRDQLDGALESLQTANAAVLGIVLNRVPKESRGAYYDYRHEYRPTVDEEGRSRGRITRRQKADARG